MRKMSWQPATLFSSPERRFAVLLHLTSFGLLSGLLITAPAWMGIRSYPLSALVAGLSAPAFLHTFIYVLLVISLASVLIVKKCRSLSIGTALLAILLLITLDITRLQPWILHYTGILLIGLCLFAIKNNRISTQMALDATAVLVGGIYFWSGLQKINAAFFLEVFPWFTQHLSAPLGEVGQALFIISGLFVPFLEAGMALGFFTKKFRYVSIVTSLVMLLVVLSSLGPFGHNWNSSIWPWNIVIFSSVIVLFYQNTDTFSSFISRQRKNTLSSLVFFVFWLMPVGNLFGITDHYLSWSLYSGRVPSAVLIGNQEFLTSFSPRASNGELEFAEWTMSTMNTVPYPQERVFRDVFSSLCEEYPKENLFLQIKTPRLFVSTDYDLQILTCSS